MRSSKTHERLLMSPIIPTTEIVFVEFAARDPAALDHSLLAMGARRIGQHRSRRLTLYAQGRLLLLLNETPSSHAAEFARAHGNSISALGFGVPDGASALQAARSAGAKTHEGTEGATLDAPALQGIGGSVLYLVDPPALEALLGGFPAFERPVGVGLTHIDHITHCVAEGTMGRWVDFYGRLFGFRVCFELEARGERTGFRTQAIKSPSGGIVITCLEPTEPASQIQEFMDEYRGEGVQHLAFSTPDIYGTVEGLNANGIEFLDTPSAYYDALDTRIPGHGEDLDRLRSLGILLDGSDRGEAPGEPGGTLLQIFTRKMVGPIFFEIIQRKGNEGFGNGNAKALFAAIEQEQLTAAAGGARG